MENNSCCVFCGQELSAFRSTTIQCGPTWQPACKACAKELKGLDEVELCRRALVRGIAEKPNRLIDWIETITEAESHRPKCLRCGSNLSFMQVQALDNSPLRDTIFKEPFEVLPAYCQGCGKYEFYDPVIARKNKYLAHLIWKDTEE